MVRSQDAFDPLESPKSLTLDRYQNHARRTDLTAKSRQQDLNFPLLGLFGEVGSLMSELKKKRRDADSYVGYELSVIEELGDVLWYFSNLASRAGIVLSELAYWAEPERGRFGGDQGITFASVQSEQVKSRETAPKEFEQTLMHLAGKVGNLVAEFSAGHLADNRDSMLNRMGSILWSLTAVSNAANVSIDKAAQGNLVKIFDRWPLERKYPVPLDENFDPDEQLPRRIEMEIFEKVVGNDTYVFQRCNGVNIGDRLTDNKLVPNNM